MSDEMLHATLSGEIYLKSRTVRARFARAVVDHASVALGSEWRVEEAVRGRLYVVGGGDPGEAAQRLSRVFGIASIQEVRELTFPDLENGVARLAEAARPLVEGRRFAVRCKRTGNHPWRSPELERRLGAELLPASAGVDLTAPDVTVRIRVAGDKAYLVTREWPGPGGLPIGVQGKALVLLSGGYDSAVAAWRLMRRGVSVEFLHFQLACAQRDQALAVAHRLWSRWGAGMDGVVHVLDFGEVRAEIIDRIHPRYRQVALKRLMVQAADAVAEELGIEAVATGEAIGQVSSQTFTHLAALDRLSSRPILRPLLACDKEEIISSARHIGVAELAQRAGEACDLSEGHRVETSLSAEVISRMAGRVSPGALAGAVRAWRVHRLEDWLPGSEGEARAA